MIISDCNGEKMLTTITKDIAKIKVAQFILGQCVESCPLSAVQAQKSGRSCFMTANLVEIFPAEYVTDSTIFLSLQVPGAIAL